MAHMVHSEREADLQHRFGANNGRSQSAMAPIAYQHPYSSQSPASSSDQPIRNDGWNASPIRHSEVPVQSTRPVEYHAFHSPPLVTLDRNAQHQANVARLHQHNPFI